MVTKLKRFHAGDREDVQMLCDTGQVGIGTLRERFGLAHASSDMDDPKVEAVVANPESVAEVPGGPEAGAVNRASYRTMDGCVRSS